MNALAIFGILAALAAVVYYVKHHGVAASVAAVKAELSKIENELPALEASAKSEVAKVVDRLKSLL
jgi:hypothetical protein